MTQINKITVLSLILLVFSGPVSAVVIDFESLQHVDSIVLPHGDGSFYSEDGFTLNGNKLTITNLRSVDNNTSEQVQLSVGINLSVSCFE